jgi:hypothetical protein
MMKQREINEIKSGSTIFFDFHRRLFFTTKRVRAMNDVGEVLV